jgi:mersacidin/lichenicidin family type 2 lantibiotic
MTSDEIVRSWKNDEYRLSLSLDDQAVLPENPAGLGELTDAELLGIDGGSFTTIYISIAVTMAICPGVGPPLTLVLPNCTLSPPAAG